MANLFAQLVKITIQKLGLNHLTKFRFERKESKNQNHLNSLNPQFFLNFAKLKNLHLSILFQIFAEIVQIQFQYLNHLFAWVSLVLQLVETIFGECWLIQIFLVILFKLNCFVELKLDYEHWNSKNKE